MKTNHIISLFSVFILFIMTSCGSGACECPDCYHNVDEDAVKTEINAISTAMLEHMNTQNVDAYLEFYAEDAISNPPGKSAEVGKAAIRAGLEEMWSEPNPPGMSFEFNSSDVWVLGDHVVETGAFSFSMDGMDEPISGKYMNLFLKEDGKYRCVRDIWNYDSMPDNDEYEEEESSEESEEGESED